MLYALMLLGIGFLTACVLMVMLAPLIHERAVRLTVRFGLDGPVASDVVASDSGLSSASGATSERRPGRKTSNNVPLEPARCEVRKRIVPS